MKDYQAEIKKHEDEIAKLKKEQAEFQSLTPVQRLAETLHALQCRHDHTEYCGWYYEKWDNHNNWGKYSAHNIYLEKANNLMAALPQLTVDEIINLARIFK